MSNDAVGTDVLAPPARPRPVSSRAKLGLTWIALLLSLVAIAGTGYLYWRLIWQAPPDALDDRLAGIDAAVGGERQARRAGDDAAVEARQQLSARVSTQADSIQLAHVELAELRAAVDAARDRPAQVETESLGTGRSEAPRTWKLAEAEYLLRMASRRVALERDAAGAIALLRSADDILAAVNETALHDVRRLLAEEVASLSIHHAVDVTGLYLRIEAAKGMIGNLPVQLPDLAADEASETPVDHPDDASTGWLTSLVDRLHGLVRIRRHDLDARRSLLAPDEAVYLERHIRLALDRAQLALLRQDQAVFEASLTEAHDWLKAHVDLSRGAGDVAAPAMTLAGELETLLGMSVASPMPDVSRSLTALRQRVAGNGAPR